MEGSKKDFPRIIIKGDCRTPEEVVIAAERTVLFSVERPDRIIDATLALLATYYVFMFEYPQSLKNFYLYLQKCILNIQDSKKLPAVVVNFVNNLN